MTDLDALAALLAAATDGPWYWDQMMGGIRVADHYIVQSGGDWNATSDESLIIAMHEALPSLIEAARREARLREALEAMVMTWFAYSDNAGRKDVLVRLAELDTFHTTVNDARALLHDNAGAALPAEGTEERVP